MQKIETIIKNDEEKTLIEIYHDVKIHIENVAKEINGDFKAAAEYLKIDAARLNAAIDRQLKIKKGL